MAIRHPRNWSAFALSLVVAGSTFAGLVPATASAAGRLLFWDNCSNGGVSIKDFACDTNDGAHDLVAAFYWEPSWSGTSIGLQAVLEIGGGDRLGVSGFTGVDFDPLPSYWRLQPPGCRGGEGVVSFDFGSPPFDRCRNPWQGQASSPSISFTYPHHSAPGATPSLLVEVSASWPEQNVLNHVGENYAFRLRISHAKTTGPDACASCCEPVTATIRSMTVLRSNGSHVGLSQETSDTVVWNRSSGPFCGATPTRNATWGMIKGFYR